MPMTVETMRLLTEFGNVAVAVPVAIAVALWTWLYWDRVLGMVYLVNVALGLAATFILKLFSAASGGWVLDSDFAMGRAAPSGHMSCAVAVYGGAAVLLAVGARGLTRVFGVAGLLVLVWFVGATRVWLGAHSPGDVLAAVAVAGLFVLFIALVAIRRGRAAHPIGLLAVLVAVALAMHASGIRLDSTAMF
jgi:membrane-associated phospholipid phosphatase